MPDVEGEHVKAVRKTRKTGVDGRVWPSHCRDSFIASQDVFYLGRISDRPVKQPRSEGLMKLTGGPLPGPLGHPAASATPARGSTEHHRLLVNKRVRRHAGS